MQQFHDFRIGESVHAYSIALQQRLSAASTSFSEKGADSVMAAQQVYGSIKTVVRNSSYVMAVNDAFLLVGICLSLGALLDWICRKPASATTSH